MESEMLQTRLGPLAWRSSGHGPTLVFFAGALANHDLWRDVVRALEDRYRCITIDLPLGAHRWPLSTGHPALGRVGRLVLTNCESHDQFPPDALRKAAALCRRFPRLARALIRLQLRSSTARRKIASTVAVSGLDHERAESFFGPARRDHRVADDLVAALAGFRPRLLIDAAEAIPRFDRPVLLIWGESCDFFPIAAAQRLAAEFHLRHAGPRSRSKDVGAH
jgi:pimeloyl-ACP methyl ester carboxylesterase